MSQQTALIAGLVAFAAWALATARSAGAGACKRLSVARVAELARAAAQQFPGVDPLMLRAMAEIESGREPCAFRPEVQISDASVGLMQTLQGTAQWLWDSMGARAYPRPTLETLTDPVVSMYFGAAYVNWLATYGGRARSEEWIVRAYNGGPGGADSPATERHWQRYQAAKARLQQGE